MSEAVVRFEREDIEGLVPVGAYLVDAGKRFGIKEWNCDVIGGEHSCGVAILSGMELLSPASAEESESVGAVKEDFEAGAAVRMACYAQIETGGDLVLMTSVKEDEAVEEKAQSAEEYKKVFAELPLQQKLTNLMELESIALGETFSYVLNSPYAIADKLMDVLAGFGFQKEEAEKKASRPPFQENGDSDKDAARSAAADSDVTAREAG